MGGLGNFGYLPIIADVVFLLICILGVISAAKKGLVKSVYRLAAVIITIILISVLITPVTSMLEESQVGAVVYKSIYQQLEHQNTPTDNSSAGISVESVWDMPEFVKNSTDILDIGNDTISIVTHTITDVILKLIAVIGLFIIIRLLLSLMFLLVEGVFKLPGLRLLNVLCGILAGVVTVLAISYVTLGVVSLDLPVFAPVKDVITETTVIRTLYDNNFLMSMFL